MPPKAKTRTTQAGRIEKTRHEPAQFSPTADPPRGVLHAAEDRGGIFFHQRLAPPPELAPLIQHLWYVQWDVRHASPATAETLPHPNCYLIFEHNLERPIDDPGVHERAEIAGVCTSKFSRSMEGYGRVFGIKFQPGGLRPFLQTSVSRLTDRVVPGAEIFGPGILALATQLRALDSAEAMAKATAGFFLERLPKADSDTVTATTLVNMILHDATILRVEEVSRRSGLSVRSLQRLFREYVGVPPKWVIRRFRLHELLERLNSGEAIDGVQLALDLGYADQAHLINDFRKLAGYAPTEYLRRADRASK